MLVLMLAASSLLLAGAGCDFANDWCPPSIDPLYDEFFPFCALGYNEGQQSDDQHEFHHHVVARFDLLEDRTVCVPGPKPGDLCSEDPSTFPRLEDTKSCKKFCDAHPTCKAYTQQIWAGHGHVSCYMLHDCIQIEAEEGTCTEHSECRSETKCPGHSQDCMKPVLSLPPVGQAGWTCLDRFEEECDLYNTDEYSKCLLDTKCLYLSSCGPEMRTHFCAGSQWWFREGVPAAEEDWADQRCDCRPLYMYAEPGLSLLCVEPGEPHTADDTGHTLTINGRQVYKILKGSCVQYCNNQRAHRIQCDQSQGTWVDTDSGHTGPFYCWQEPDPVPECMEDSECPDARPSCLPTGICAECLSSEDCPGRKPNCNPDFVCDSGLIKHLK